MLTALQRLPERSRQVFYLSRFEGLTQREIAVRLRLSRTSVEKHMRRALECVADARTRLEGKSVPAARSSPIKSQT
jgi:RNA polymerase sigma-70 factor (ECF subfamily)